jgi:CheY-like chemotaxis protein
MPTCPDGISMPDTILVIEDDPECREAVVFVLELEGYRVVAVEHGLAGLHYLDAHDPPALILLDLMLPVMDGWRFVSEQRARPALAAIPVVLMSGERDLAKQATRLGVAGSIEKPLAIDALAATVRKFATPASRPAPPLASSPHRVPALARTLDGLRVLLVDDDALVVEALTILLAAAGAETAAASSAEGAWTHLTHNVPDVLVSDVVLAEGLIRRIRAHPPTRALHAIALTQRVLPGDRERTLAAGFDRCLTKPIDIDELRALLAEVARKP